MKGKVIESPRPVVERGETRDRALEVPIEMNNAENIQGIRTAAEFAAETLIPGGSNAVKGDLKVAGIYAVAGLAARATFGLPGLLLVSADSFIRATTGQPLTAHLGIGRHSEKQPAAKS
jgi:hypothetical protein